MATYIFDIDGTLVDYRTNDFFPGVLEKLKDLTDKGHDIILITMRGTQDLGKKWSIENTQRHVETPLKAQGIRYRILYAVQSPRLLIDDAPIQAIQTRDGSYFR